MRYGSSLMTFSIQCMKKLLPPLIERVVNMVWRGYFGSWEHGQPKLSVCHVAGFLSWEVKIKNKNDSLKTFGDSGYGDLLQTDVVFRHRAGWRQNTSQLGRILWYPVFQYRERNEEQFENACIFASV